MLQGLWLLMLERLLKSPPIFTELHMKREGHSILYEENLDISAQILGNIWAGGSKSQYLPLAPDEGPSQADRSKGVVVIGTTKWVDNYNVPVFSTNISAVRKIAKRVSERGGGLPSVQAMALVHGEGVIEVACNLLDPQNVGGEKVQDEVERLAVEEGMVAGKGYFTDFSRDEIIKMFLEVGN